jgi:hypothetical protein
MIITIKNVSLDLTSHLPKYLVFISCLSLPIWNRSASLFNSLQMNIQKLSWVSFNLKEVSKV